MPTSNIFKSFTLCLVLTILLAACSGGSTSNGLGLGVGGTWFGSLSRGSVPFASFTLNLSQATDDESDPFSSNSLSGVFNSNNQCISGGTISGSLTKNNINITVSTNNGVLTLSGTASNSAMSGSWSNTGQFTIDTETVGQSTTETTATTSTPGNNGDENGAGSTDPSSTTTSTTNTTPEVVTTTETVTCNFGGSWAATR